MFNNGSYLHISHALRAVAGGPLDKVVIASIKSRACFLWYQLPIREFVFLVDLMSLSCRTGNASEELAYLSQVQRVRKTMRMQGFANRALDMS